MVIIAILNIFTKNNLSHAVIDKDVTRRKRIIQIKQLDSLGFLNGVSLHHSDVV